ncbi:MAG: hypothetical protein HRU01_19415 [Myxococcales bacterium]|nr:hypothetical protein [Myxococcales bacterium]
MSNRVEDRREGARLCAALVSRDRGLVGLVLATAVMVAVVAYLKYCVAVDWALFPKVAALVVAGVVAYGSGMAVFGREALAEGVSTLQDLRGGSKDRVAGV